MPPTSIVRVAYITNCQLKRSNEQPFSQLSTPFVLHVHHIFTMAEPDSGSRGDGKERFARLVERPGMERFQLVGDFDDMVKVPSLPGGNCDIYTAHLRTATQDSDEPLKVAIKRLRAVVSEEDKVWKVRSSTNATIPYRLNDKLGGIERIICLVQSHPPIRSSVTGILHR